MASSNMAFVSENSKANVNFNSSGPPTPDTEHRAYENQLLKDHDGSCSEDEEDERITVDLPVPGKSQFVSRVEHAVKLQTHSSATTYQPITIPSFFYNAAQRYKQRTAFVTFQSDSLSPVTCTYDKYYQRALRVAKGLIAVGLRPQQGVAFMCHDSLKTFYGIMGAIMAGGIYVDLCAPDNRNWIVATMAETKCAVVFVDTEFAKDVQLEAWDELPHMKSIIMIHGEKGQDGRTITIKDLIKEGSSISDQVLARRLGSHAPNKCCAIFYRSNEILNQSSTPGVMMSHDNLTLMANLIAEKIQKGHLGNFPDIRTKALKIISIIPITKPLAFVMEALLPLAIGACVYTTSARLSTVSLWRVLTTVRPNIFWATIRTWTHLRSKITERTRYLTKVKGMIFKYSKQAMLDSVLEGSAVPRLSRLVVKEVTKALGLDQVGLFFCFGQALPQNHFEYFLSLNMQIFALRENRFLSGPPSLCICTEDFRTESMGTLFQEFETKMVRLGKTSAQKLYIKGRCVCMGLLHESIADRIDSDGFLDTDILTATVQDDLFFVGTSGEEIMLRTGAILPYNYVESSFKRLTPIVANCMVVGDNMKTAALLITLKTVINPETLHPTDALTQEVQVWCEQKLGGTYHSAEVLSCSKKLHVVINGALVIINMLMRKSGGWIEAYKILPRDFAIPDCEIDPITMELNRNVILQRYRDDISNLYPNEPAW